LISAGEISISDANGFKTQTAVRFDVLYYADEIAPQL
jgi:hypothetical protein